MQPIKRSNTSGDHSGGNPRKRVASGTASNANAMHHLSNSNKASDPFGKSTRLILEYSTQSTQSYNCYSKKIELKEALELVFKDIFPYLGVYIVGSSANGFGTNDSDMDICVVVSHEEIHQRNEAIWLLSLIANAMRKSSFLRNVRVIHAKCPIIKFHDMHNNIDCDINLNNFIGIHNTHLLKCYNDMDWRVKPLILSIKRWANCHDINDASKQTLSSYSLCLMTIYFLQGVCEPPVLPVLQQVMPDKFNLDMDVRKLKLNDDLLPWTSSNTQSLGELFGEFIYYYADFKFQYHVISVRTGSTHGRDKIAPAPQSADGRAHNEWKYVMIEEPFDLTNTARSVFDYDVFTHIVSVFKKSAKRYAQCKDINELLTESFCESDRRSRNDY